MVDGEVLGFNPIIRELFMEREWDIIPKLYIGLCGGTGLKSHNYIIVHGEGLGYNPIIMSWCLWRDWVLIP